MRETLAVLAVLLSSHVAVADSPSTGPDIPSSLTPSLPSDIIETETLGAVPAVVDDVVLIVVLKALSVISPATVKL